MFQTFFFKSSNFSSNAFLLSICNFFLITMVLISFHICHLVTFHCHFLKTNPKTVTGCDLVHQCSKHTHQCSKHRQTVPFETKGCLSHIYQYDSDSESEAIAKNWCCREFKSVNELHSADLCCNYAD